MKNLFNFAANLFGRRGRALPAVPSQPVLQEHEIETIILAPSTIQPTIPHILALANDGLHAPELNQDFREAMRTAIAMRYGLAVEKGINFLKNRLDSSDVNALRSISEINDIGAQFHAVDQSRSGSVGDALNSINNRHMVSNQAAGEALARHIGMNNNIFTPLFDNADNLRIANTIYDRILPVLGHDGSQRHQIINNQTNSPIIADIQETWQYLPHSLRKPLFDFLIIFRHNAADPDAFKAIENLRMADRANQEQLDGIEHHLLARIKGTIGEQTEGYRAANNGASFTPQQISHLSNLIRDAAFILSVDDVMTLAGNLTDSAPTRVARSPIANPEGIGFGSGA